MNTTRHTTRIYTFEVTLKETVDILADTLANAQLKLEACKHEKAIVSEVKLVREELMPKLQTVNESTIEKCVDRGLGEEVSCAVCHKKKTVGEMFVAFINNKYALICKECQIHEMKKEKTKNE